MDPSELIEAARHARRNALTPYSGFPVGAALVCRGGRLYTGCNIEASSFSLTICAERVALFKALSEGEREFEAMAVVGPVPDLRCCGACRQVLWDFAPGLVLYTEGESDRAIRRTIAELLPKPFDKSLLPPDK